MRGYHPPVAGAHELPWPSGHETGGMPLQPRRKTSREGECTRQAKVTRTEGRPPFPVEQRCQRHVPQCEYTRTGDN
eukprot:8605335-Pyramimonas_sp.AAC.1